MLSRLPRVQFFSFLVGAGLLLTAAADTAAEQVLELKLHPPASSSASSAGDPARERATVRLPSRGSQPGTRPSVTLGKVGYVESGSLAIRRSYSTSAATLFTVQKGTPLLVINTVGKWYGVAMSDGSTGWVPTSSLSISDMKVVSDGPAVSSSVTSMLQHAMTYLGSPYVWGGNSRSGIDCSGFVKKVWEFAGKRLPRTSREQALVGERVEPESLAAGDRLYFACKGGDVDHTGIYMGRGLFIHSSSSRGGVAIEQLASSRYLNWLVGIRRG